MSSATAWPRRSLWSSVLAVSLGLMAAPACRTATCSESFPSICAEPTPRLVGLNVDVVNLCERRREVALVMSDSSRAADLTLVSSDPEVLTVRRHQYCKEPAECYFLEGRKAGKVQLTATTSRVLETSGTPRRHVQLVEVVPGDCRPR